MPRRKLAVVETQSRTDDKYYLRSSAETVCSSSPQSSSGRSYLSAPCTPVGSPDRQQMQPLKDLMEWSSSEKENDYADGNEPNLDMEKFTLLFTDSTDKTIIAETPTKYSSDSLDLFTSLQNSSQDSTHKSPKQIKPKSFYGGSNAKSLKIENSPSQSSIQTDSSTSVLFHSPKAATKRKIIVKKTPSAKRRRNDGGINRGVSHSIKKPKVKKDVPNKRVIEITRDKKESKGESSNSGTKNTKGTDVYNDSMSEHESMSESEETKKVPKYKAMRLANTKKNQAVANKPLSDQNELRVNKRFTKEMNLTTNGRKMNKKSQFQIVAKTMLEKEQKVVDKDIQSIIDSFHTSDESDSNEQSVPDKHTRTPPKVFPLFNQSKHSHNSLTERKTTASPNKPNTSWVNVKSTPTSSERRKFKLYNSKDGKEQLLIDAGQKEFGAKKCKDCGFLYSVGEAEDEDQHNKFHNKDDAVLKFPGWKNVRMVGNYMDGYVVSVTPSDPKSWRNKVAEIKALVDKDLGFPRNNKMGAVNSTVYLYIVDKKVVGCLISENISNAHRVVSTHLNSTKPYCCDTVPVPAICGISRVWTASFYRKKKVATRLVDCMRRNYAYGMILGIDQIAFSHPSAQGMIFAEKYTRKSNFLVYN